MTQKRETNEPNFDIPRENVLREKGAKMNYRGARKKECSAIGERTVSN